MSEYIAGIVMLGYTLVIDTHSFDPCLSFMLQRESVIDCWPQFREAYEGGAKLRRLGRHRRLRKRGRDRCRWNAGERIGGVPTACASDSPDCRHA